MRIAYLSFEAFGHGGIRTYTRELLNRIAGAGHQVVLLSPPSPAGMATGLVPDVELRPVPTSRLPFASSPTFWMLLPFMLRSTEKADGRFEVIHSNTYSDALLPRFASKALRITTVHHLGTTAAESMGLSLLARLSHPSREYGPAVALEGLCIRRAHHLIATSEFTRTDILTRYPDVDPSRISVIYQGASVRSFGGSPDAVERLKKTWRLNRDDRILLYVGRLEERKGIRFLFEAFARLERDTNARLLLVGAGTHVYKHLASKMGIGDRVVFAGFVSDDALDVAYTISSALLHPAPIEGFGLGVADAVATHLPVVACRVGSIPEVVRDGIDGYLVEYGDSEAFCRAIEKALDINRRTEGRDDINAPTRFTWERTASETLALYDRLYCRGLA